MKRIPTRLVFLFALLFAHVPANAQIITTIAGTGSGTFSGDGSPATTATIHNPYGVCVDASGNIYIADASNQRIRKINTSGIMSTICGNGSGALTGDGGAATAAQIFGPTCVALDGSGNLYICDQDNQRIRKINTSGVISTVAGSGPSGIGMGGSSGDGGQATAARLNYPTGMTVDGAGNIYIADQYNHKVRKINTSGIITTIAGTGSFGFGGDGGAATAATLYLPCGVAVDGAGNVYITDYGNHRIRMVNTSGIISTVAGSTSGYGGDGGPATAALMINPWGIATDASNNIYIADPSGQRIRKINTSGIINTITGTGSAGFAGDGGLAATATVSSPCGIFVSSSGVVYFDDLLNNRVRMISGNNRCPLFTGGHSQNLSVCQNSAGDSINTLLSIVDTDLLQTETISVWLSPAHGTVTASYTTTSTGGTIVPTGKYYVPTAGYTGNDSFKVIVSDGVLSDTTIIYVTVNPLPSAITGLATVCVGATTTLSDGVTGGTWSCSNIVHATIGSSTGVVTGVLDGLDTIKYTLPTGCYVSIVVTVSTPSAPIVGPSTLCPAATASYSNVLSGGTWSSSNTAAATIGSSSGIATGVGAGVTVISYLLPGCFYTKSVTVNPVVSPVTGPGVVCVGATITLSDLTTGGMWSSATPGIAAVGTSSGVVTGASAGVVNITYTAATGCYSVKSITVNPLPAVHAVTGGGSFCFGGTGLHIGLDGSDVGVNYQLYNGASPVGTPLAGTGGALDFGVFTSPGTYTVSAVMASTGCVANMSGSVSIVVNPLPAPITGAASVCVGSTTTLSDATPGGTWSSSNFAIANIGSVSGLVSGVSVGSVTITYTSAPGCIAIMSFSVNPLPSISGAMAVCQGGSTAEIGTPGGGAWSSSNIGVANIGSISGMVSGVSVGTAIITYTSTLGCKTTISFSVNPLPSISGVPAICQGGSTTETGTPGGGTWSSSNVAIADIGSISGLVSGISVGTATITYTSSPGCITTMSFSVNPLPSISGALAVCQGGSITETGTPSGGTWSSIAPSVATVTPVTGIVTGVSNGTATIVYTLSTGCAANVVVTVNPLPAGITGVLSVCPGTTSLLSDVTSGGNWTSSNPATATIGSTSGMVTGVAPGNTTITYTLPTGCSTSVIVTVNTSPDLISGGLVVCPGTTSTLTDGTPGGTWVSGNVAAATIGSMTGTVTGVASGTSTITYTLPTGCKTIAIVTVNSSPAAIAGVLNMCPGNTTTLTDPSVGGTWSSSLPGTASIDPVTGVVTGIVPGTATITYSLGTGCITTAVVTVNSLPGTYTVVGGGSFCAGGTGMHVGLSGSSPGITYQLYVGITAVGGPVPGTGSPLDFGMQTTAGTYTVKATNSFGCTITMTGSATIIVNPLPGAITGPSSVCTGASILLSDPSVGGVWASANPAIATIGSTSGIVNGIATGSSVITYTLPTGCATTTIVNVTTGPSTISGAGHICVGAATLFTDGVGGGSWASSNPAIATIGSLSGVATGISGGSVTITYTLGTGCTVYKSLTVDPAPAVIIGAASLCAGNTTTLTDATTGGTWSSGTPTIATIGPVTGFVTAMSAGVTTITYTLASSGCIATKDVTVTPNPAAIAGPVTLCVGATVTETDAVPGGTWNTASIFVSITPTTGLVTGISAGPATITYSIGACTATRVITVNTSSSITGAGGVCIGSTITLSCPGGGSWLSSDPATAAVGSTTGVVTGVAAGTATITYTSPTGCISTKPITVSTTPAPITGTTNVCAGGATTLAATPAGGTWSSAAPTVATIGSATGVLNGIAPGTSMISYSMGGCNSVTMITVNPVPAVISGTLHVCPGATSLLADATTGGSWSSSNLAIATIGAGTGIASGIVPGTVTISYTLGTGCAATATFTVNTLPGGITGTLTACVGTTTALSDAPSGGLWTSANPAVATVGAGTGTVTGVSAGSASITYSLGPGCNAVTTVTINPLPSAITGSTNICIGALTTLHDSTAGGTWSSGAPAIATVGSVSGIVNGVSGGVAAMTYTGPNGCIAVKSVMVMAVPPITGITNMCAWFDTITVHDADTTGVYTSSLVTVSNLGGGAAYVLAHGPGLATVYYTIPGGCVTHATLSINPMPAPITGATDICMGSTATWLDGAPGGVWSSGAPAIASVGSSSGVVTGVAAGGTHITYTLPSGCKTDTAVTIQLFPDAGTITGLAHLCMGASVSLSASTGGGVWSSVNTVATVSGTGTVTGITPGVDTIMYSVTNSCGTATTTIEMTVNPIPDAGMITGSGSVCVGNTTMLSSSVMGGTWSTTSGNATVSPTGIVTGVNAGTDTIIYSVSALGCNASTSHAITIIPLAACPILNVRTPVATSDLRLWPSPNDGTFNVQLSSAADEDVQVVITNITGERMKSFTLRSNYATGVRLIAPAGLYFISAVTIEGTFVGKVVVE